MKPAERFRLVSLTTAWALVAAIDVLHAAPSRAAPEESCGTKLEESMDTITRDLNTSLLQHLNANPLTTGPARKAKIAVDPMRAADGAITIAAAKALHGEFQRSLQLATTTIFQFVPRDDVEKIWRDKKISRNLGDDQYSKSLNTTTDLLILPNIVFVNPTQKCFQFRFVAYDTREGLQIATTKTFSLLNAALNTSDLDEYVVHAAHNLVAHLRPDNDRPDQEFSFSAGTVQTGSAGTVQTSDVTGWVLMNKFTAFVQEQWDTSYKGAQPVTGATKTIVPITLAIEYFARPPNLYVTFATSGPHGSSSYREGASIPIALLEGIGASIPPSGPAMTDLQKQLDAANAALEQARHDLHDKDLKLADQTNLQLQLGANKTALEQANQALSDRLVDLKGAQVRLNAAKAALDLANRDMQDKDGRLAELEALKPKLDAANSALTQLTNERNEALQKLVTATAQADSLGRERDDLRRRIDIALRQIDPLKAAGEALLQQRDAANVKIFDLNYQVYVLNNQISALQVSMHDAARTCQSSIDTREASIAGLQRQASQCTAAGKGVIWVAGATVYRSADVLAGAAPSYGWFAADTEIDILRRVPGPDGWDALEVRGITAETNRSVSGFVRSDLVAGKSVPITPQTGRRCFTAHDTDDYGVARLYDRTVVQRMTSLKDSTYDSLIKFRLADDGRVYSIASSIRGPNGWEWEVVNFVNNVSGVVRADQLHIAPCPT